MQGIFLARQQRDNQKETALEQAEMSMPDMGGVRPGSPQWQQQYDALRNDPAYEALNDAEITELLVDRSDAATGFQELTFDMDSVDDFFERQDELIGSGWNERAARAEMRNLRRNAPRELRNGITDRFESLIDRSNRRADGTVDTGTINRNIKGASQAIIKEILPEKGLAMLAAAKAKGVGLVEYITQYEPDAAQALLQAENYIQSTAEAAIDEETRKQGRRLRPGEQATIINDVIQETLKNKELMANFAPVMEKSAPPAASTTPGAQSSAPPAKPPTYFSAAQPVPEDVVKSGVPIYSPQTTVGLLQVAADGGPIPATVKRAARAANMTTGEFLLQQADQLGLGDQVPEEMRRSVRRVSVRERGTEDTLIGAAPASTTPLSFATNAFMNIITGTRPAAAATRSTVQSIPVIQPGGSYIASVDIGGQKGMSADGMTQTLHGLRGRNGYDKDHGVGNDHVHHGAPDRQTALALANFLTDKKIPIWEFAQWGDVSSVHQDPGHYNGMSFDIPVGVEEHARVLALIDSFYRSR